MQDILEKAKELDGDSNYTNVLVNQLKELQRQKYFGTNETIA